MLARLVGHPVKEFGFDFPASIKALTILDVNSANDFLLLADRANFIMSLVQDPGIYFGHVNKLPKHFDVPMACLHIYTIQYDQHVSEVHTAHAFIVC